MEGRIPMPRLTQPHFPSADLGSVREIARHLVEAENPGSQPAGWRGHRKASIFSWSWPS